MMAASTSTPPAMSSTLLAVEQFALNRITHATGDEHGHADGADKTGLSLPDPISYCKLLRELRAGHIKRGASESNRWSAPIRKTKRMMKLK